MDGAGDPDVHHFTQSFVGSIIASDHDNQVYSGVLLWSICFQKEANMKVPKKACNLYFYQWGATREKLVAKRGTMTSK